MATNLKAFLNMVQRDVTRTLREDVYQEVQSTMMVTINKVVYEAYNPRTYMRQYDRGGLVDPENINITEKGKGRIVVRNTRSDGNEDVAYNVETGTGYVMQYGEKAFPRPFTAKTVERLESSGSHAEAMEDGLSSLGYNVRR